MSLPIGQCGLYGQDRVFGKMHVDDGNGIFHKLSGRTGATTSRGFTIVELLVAIGIFVSVMAGVGILFVNSVRVMRQGFQNQEAFEQARTTLNVVERDLSRAFTSRAHGDYYQFYGTPIGFTFVGLASPDPNDNRPSNLARVTYVVYHDCDDEILDDIESAQRATYRLLRYVEPDAETLDDFPVPWDSPDLAGTDSNGLTVGDLIDAEIAARCPNCDEEQQEAIARVKKRELWIHMLAGGNGADIPNAWVTPCEPNKPQVVQLGGPVEDYVLSDKLLHVFFNQFYDPANPLSATAAVSQRLLMHNNIFPTIYQNDTALIVNSNAIPLQFGPDGKFVISPMPTYFFTYADYNVNSIDTDGDSFTTNDVVSQIRANPMRFWGDLRNVGTGIGDPAVPRLPQNVSTHFTLFFPSPYAGAPDFQKTFDQNIDIPSGYRRLPAE